MTTDPLAFRLAGPDDVPSIVELVQSAYRGESSRTGWTTEANLLDGQRTDAAEVGAAISNPRYRTILITDADGRLTGSCLLQQRDAGLAYFGMFSVRPQAQGRGTGRALLAEAERVAAEELACSVVEMTVIIQRTELIAWYERRGYQRTGRIEPFPYGEERFGVPRRTDLAFEVLRKQLSVTPPPGSAG